MCECSQMCACVFVYRGIEPTASAGLSAVMRLLIRGRHVISGWHSLQMHRSIIHEREGLLFVNMSANKLDIASAASICATVAAPHNDTRAVQTFGLVRVTARLARDSRDSVTRLTGHSIGCSLLSIYLSNH